MIKEKAGRNKHRPASRQVRSASKSQIPNPKSQIDSLALRNRPRLLDRFRPRSRKTELRRSPQVRDKQFAYEGHFLRQAIVKLEEEIVMHRDLLKPQITVYGHHLFILLSREVEPAPIHVLISRHPAERRLGADRFSARAFDDPFQHAHILAIARPRELSVCVLEKPVHR